MTGMEDISAVYLVRGREYVVTLTIQQESSLLIEVDDRETGEEWRGEFDAHCEYIYIYIYIYIYMISYISTSN